MITTNYLPKRKEVLVDFDTNMEEYMYLLCNYIKEIKGYILN